MQISDSAWLRKEVANRLEPGPLKEGSRNERNQTQNFTTDW
jgi:hypothetical protein